MATPIEQRGYAHPDVLVSTDWVEKHLKDPKVRLIESNEDTLLYAAGHVPGAVHVDWTTDLNDQLRRDCISREVQSYPKTQYKAKERNDAPIRAYRDDVHVHLKKRGQLVDVRSPEEYAGT